MQRVSVWWRLLLLLEQDLFDHLHEALLRHGAHADLRLALHGHEDDCRDAAHAECPGQLALLVDVDLVDHNLVLISLGQVLEHRSHASAGAAPIGVEVDVLNSFFSSPRGKGILKKINHLRQHGGDIDNVLSQADVDSIVKVFEHGAGKSAFEKMERFDKLNDEIVEKTMSNNYINASRKYTPAFEAQTRDILCKGNKHSSECDK